MIATVVGRGSRAGADVEPLGPSRHGAPGDHATPPVPGGRLRPGRRLPCRARRCAGPATSRATSPTWPVGRPRRGRSRCELLTATTDAPDRSPPRWAIDGLAGVLGEHREPATGRAGRPSQMGDPVGEVPHLPGAPRPSVVDHQGPARVGQRGPGGPGRVRRVGRSGGGGRLAHAGNRTRLRAAAPVTARTPRLRPRPGARRARRPGPPRRWRSGGCRRGARSPRR
jgi:hypothetical protein